MSVHGWFVVVVVVLFGVFVCGGNNVKAVKRSFVI